MQNFMTETEVNAYKRTSTKISTDAPFFQLLYNEIMSVSLPREKVLVVILQPLITCIRTASMHVCTYIYTYIEHVFTDTGSVCTYICTYVCCTVHGGVCSIG